MVRQKLIQIYLNSVFYDLNEISLVFNFLTYLFCIVAVEARQWSWTRKCCGRSYNPTFYMCCNCRIQRKSGFSPRCCGTRAYDAAFYMCCRGNIKFKAGLISPRCCGTRAYDALFYRCCNGRVKFNRCQIELASDYVKNISVHFELIILNDNRI